MSESWKSRRFRSTSPRNRTVALKLAPLRTRMSAFTAVSCNVFVNHMHHHRFANSVGHKVYGLITLANLALPICASKAFTPCSSLVFMHIPRRHRLWNWILASTGHNLNSHPARLTCLTLGDGRVRKHSLQANRFFPRLPYLTRQTTPHIEIAPFSGMLSSHLLPSTRNPPSFPSSTCSKENSGQGQCISPRSRNDCIACTPESWRCPRWHIVSAVSLCKLR